MNLLKSKKIGFIGAGNMAQAIIGALLKAKLVEPNQIYVTNRSEKKLQKVAEQFGVHALANNEELVDICNVVFLATKPQDLFLSIETIAMSFGKEHIVISLAAGISLKSLQKVLSQVEFLFRAMPNTPVRIQRAVVGICGGEKAAPAEQTVRDLLNPLGFVVPVAEGEPFEALTVACGSGTGFVFELMSYWQDWLEDYGYEPETARKMTVETFLGASLLAAEAAGSDILELQNQVVSKKGVTFAGLESMRELELERVLRYSFEKAVLRDQELGKTLST